MAHYLGDLQNFVCLSNCLYCVVHAQTLPGPDPNFNVLRVLQISSTSVHFQHSYSGTSEHHQIALYCKSNIRLKPTKLLTE